MTLVLTVVFVALVFEYINGFHDTANSIATVVSTKVLTPRQAVLLAAGTNLCGALVGTAVAKTISSGLVDAKFVTSQTIICALLGAIAWNLLTWWFGLPSSSTHALVGGLIGATVAGAHGDWGVVIWSKPGTAHWWEGSGILYKVVLPMVSSPIAGFTIGLVFMSLLYICLRHWRPRNVTRVFGKLQLLSASYMGFSHGSNDAQKTMGIITLALVVATKAGLLAGAPVWLQTPEGTPADHLAPIAWLITHLPSWLQFGYTPSAADPKSQFIPVWITVVCALTMCAGTAAGGWRIIKTMGHKMVKIQPVHGFAAETTAATVLLVAAHFGMPVSTTHAITTSIMGVGAAKRWSALKLGVVERILWAWVLTIPAAALVAWVCMKLVQACGWS
ncbi:MAG: inorganic phosphate transporter [Verrucomicrobia bacterium]|nr:inorganic phosphate transporter [Verrucomicrobiota bacterium]